MADVGQERALRSGRLLGRGPRRLGFLDGRGQGRRPFHDPPLEGLLLGFDLAVQPGVLDGSGDEASDGVQERSVAGPHVAPRRPVVDREDPDGATLRDERRAEERGHLHQLGERPVAFVRILVDVAEQQRAVGAVELNEVGGAEVEGQAQRGHGGRHLRAAADRAPTGEDPGLLVREEDQRPVEPEVPDDRGERSVEQLVAVEGRPGGAGQLVEGHQLGYAILQVPVGLLQRRNASSVRCCWARTSSARRRAAPP